MEFFEAVESEWTTLAISADDARALRIVGERLASQREWWGSPDASDDEFDEAVPIRSAIHCRMTTAGQWQIRVAERVGVVSVANATIRVRPKVDAVHALFLMREGSVSLRDALSLDDARVKAESAAGFWEVVCQGFVNAAEAVVAADLVRDYQSVREELPLVRGRLAVGATTRNLLQGSLRFDCEYEEFSADVPINRYLNAATGAVIQSPLLSLSLRRRAMRIRGHMAAVGDVQPGDRRAISLDRRTAYYTDAIQLGDLVLAAGAESWREGTSPASAFLIRTPTLVQRGIQQVLARTLGPRWNVRAEKVSLGGINESVNPDLVFGAREAVADVKYKIAPAIWNRADLYEVTAFAEHLGTTRAAIVDFGQARRPEVVLGDITIAQLPWDDSAGAPEVAEAAFIEAVRRWLGNEVAS